MDVLREVLEHRLIHSGDQAFVDGLPDQSLRHRVGDGHEIVASLDAVAPAIVLHSLAHREAPESQAGEFFDRYTLDSDQRFYVNEVATYFEILQAATPATRPARG